jgi:putative transposase
MSLHQAISYGHIIPGSEFIRSLARQGTISKEASKRLLWFDFYRLHPNVRLTCRHFAISPTTFYKWFERFDPYDLTTLEDGSRRPRHVRQPEFPREVIERVLALRDRYPRWSRDKLAILLQRERLRARGLLVEPENVRQANLARRRRQKPRYAARKPRDFQAHQPGDLVEIDTLRIQICPNEVRFQFGAIDIISRFWAAKVYRRQTSTAGADFLHYLRKKFPFRLRALQIDGGSEFKAQFEAACRQVGLPLYVNPPRCPELNGHIERVNRTAREEFYEVEDLDLTVEGLNRQLEQGAYEYNHIRPHRALKLKTPAEYVRAWKRQLRKREASTMP